MRASNSTYPSDRIDAASIVADSRILGPRSAAIRLLSSSPRTRKDQRKVTIRVPLKLRNEMAELLTYIDGLPIRICLRIKDIPAEMQSDFLSRGNDIHSRLSCTLEKLVDRMRGSSTRIDPPLKQPLAVVGTTSNEESSPRLPVLPNETVLRVGPVVLDLLERSARRGDRKINLRPREFQLLKYMMQRSDSLLTRAALLKEVWNYRFVPETNLVDVHMGRLRRKLDEANELPMIRNIRGVGFILNATPCSLSSKPAQRTGNPAIADESRPSVKRAAL